MYNQAVTTNNVAAPDVGGLPINNGLQLNPGYKGSLSPKDLNEIQTKYPRFLELEKKTGVPWKVIAALDIAGEWKVSAGTAAKEIQNACREGGVNIHPKASRSELMAMFNSAKSTLEPGSWEAHLLDTAKVFYDDIGAAFSE